MTINIEKEQDSSYSMNSKRIALSILVPVVATILSSCATEDMNAPLQETTTNTQLSWNRFGNTVKSNTTLGNISTRILPIIESSPLCQSLDLADVGLVLYNNAELEAAAYNETFFAQGVMYNGMLNSRGFTVSINDLTPETVQQIFGDKRPYPSSVVFIRDYEAEEATSEIETSEATTVHEITHICQDTNSRKHLSRIDTNIPLHENTERYITIENTGQRLDYGYTGIVGIYYPEHQRTYYFSEYEEITSYLEEIHTNVLMQDTTMKLSPDEINADTLVAMIQYMETNNSDWRYRAYLISMYDDLNLAFSTYSTEAISFEYFIGFVMKNDKGLIGLRDDLILRQIQKVENADSISNAVADIIMAEVFIDE